VDVLETKEPTPEEIQLNKEKQQRPYFRNPPLLPARTGSSQSQQMLRSLAVAPQTRGMPTLTPKPQSAAPAPGPQSAAPSESRKMLASLFPEDRMLQGAQ